MSETIEHDATQGDDAAPQPETNDAPAPGTEQSPIQDTKPDTEDPKAKLEELEKTVRRLAFEEREAKRQARAYQEQIAKLTPPRDPNAPPSAADMDRIVEERAAQLLERREAQTRTQAWLAAGQGDYPDFDERCNQLADLGAGDNPSFMAAITKLPAGHKVLAELAERPGEAVRILKLNPVDMAIELAGIATRVAVPAPKPAPKPASKAPEPIKPIAATATAEPDPSRMSPEEFQRWWNKRTRG